MSFLFLVPLVIMYIEYKIILYKVMDIEEAVNFFGQLKYNPDTGIPTEFIKKYGFSKANAIYEAILKYDFENVEYRAHSIFYSYYAPCSVILFIYDSYQNYKNYFGALRFKNNCEIRALENKKVNLAEALPFKNDYQLKAFYSGKATISEAFHFKNNWQIRALNSGKATVAEALRFENNYQIQALMSEKANVVEALRFENSYQIQALISGKANVAEALRFENIYQVMIFYSGKYTAAEATVHDLNYLKNLYSGELCEKFFYEY